MQIDAVLAEADGSLESSKVEERTPSTDHERRDMLSDGAFEAALRASQAQAALRATQAREGFLLASQARVGSGSEHMCQSGQLKEGGG